MTNRIAKVLFVAIIITTIASCEKRNCSNVSCPQGQTCYQGQCICPDGYEGSDCQTLSSTKYVGSYNVYESCNGGGPCNFCNYNVSIWADGSDARIIHFNNLFNQGVSGGAYIVNYPATYGAGTDLQIPSQSYGSITYSGTGTFNPNTHQMIIQFNYTFNGLEYGCTHTFYQR